MDRLPASFIPPIALDFKSETPLYRQISTWFQRAILAGQLQPGQRVPSTRALAEELGISRNNLFDKQPRVDIQTYGSGTYFYSYDAAFHQGGAVGRFFTPGAVYEL